MKINLSQRLRKRTETIEYRKLLKCLYRAAENKQTEYFVISIEVQTLMMLENEGLKIEKNNEFGYERYKISWYLP